MPAECYFPAIQSRKSAVRERLTKMSNSVGGVTNEERRTMPVALDFLDPSKSYVATLYADSADADYKTKPDGYVITSGRVDSRSVLKIAMARGGGFAISIREATEADKKLKRLK